MTDERDPLLDEIGRALSIEPAPDFAARVRAVVAQERVRRLSVRWVTAACVAVVALVVAVSTWRWPDAIPEARTPAGAPPVTSAAAAVDQDVSATSLLESPIRKRARSPAAGRRPRASSAASAIVVSRAEVAAFWQLLASPPEETVVFVSPGQALRAEDGGLLPLPDIEPIEVPVLDINPLPRHRDVSETGGGAHE